MNGQNAPHEIPSGDERLLAMLSHLSVFMGGIILPIIIWATQKDKSRFVKFHSLQAIFLQLVLVAIVIIIVIILVIIMLIAGAGSDIFGSHHHGGQQDMPPVLIFLLIATYSGIFLIILSGIIYSVYLALKSYNGFLIKIPVIGNMIYKKVYEQN